MKDLKSQFRDWAASMPADEGYVWADHRTCAVAQFAATLGTDFDGLYSREGDRVFLLDGASFEMPHTFGALTDRLSQ